MTEENKKTEQTTEAPAEKPAEAPQAEQAPKPSAPSAPNDEKWLSVVAYASVGFALPLILKPESKKCQFHAKQGLGMFVVSIAVLFVLAVPSTLFAMLGTLLFLGFFALTILAMFQASQGKEWKIPILGDITAKLDLSKFLGSTSAAKPAEAAKKEEETKPQEAPAQPEAVEETSKPGEAPAEPTTEEVSTETEEAPATEPQPTPEATAPEAPAEEETPAAPAEEETPAETPAPAAEETPKPEETAEATPAEPAAQEAPAQEEEKPAEGKETPQA